MPDPEPDPADFEEPHGDDGDLLPEQLHQPPRRKTLPWEEAVEWTFGRL